MAGPQLTGRRVRIAPSMGMAASLRNAASSLHRNSNSAAMSLGSLSRPSRMDIANIALAVSSWRPFSSRSAPSAGA